MTDTSHLSSEQLQSSLEKVLMANITEQRRKRRWSIFFKIIAIIMIFGLIGLIFGDDDSTTEKNGMHTALIDAEGMLAQSESFNADDIAASLRLAFEDKGTKGIILRLNSPGGTPVQASYIFKEVKRLREKYPKIPVYAVCTDMCASGAYYVAASADKIYADPSSLIGSIGVIMNGFGFEDAMKKVGVERRLITAGKYKAFLDPFSPENETEKQMAEKMLGEVHTQFINAVKTGRGDKLKDNPDIFTGLIWTGEQALALGLIDDFGSAGSVARDVIGAPDIVDFSARPDYFSKLSQLLGMESISALMSKSKSKMILLQ